MADKNQKGWILIHRQIQECVIWADSDPFDRRSAWIDLLLLVNHSDKQILFNGNPITIKRGQYLTSVRKLADRWHWSNDRTLRYLRLLESLQMITKESDKSRTLLTIENYELYQDMCDSNKYSHKDSDKDSHKSQTKNEKELKELKDIYGDYHHVKLTKDQYEKLGSEFGDEMRFQAIRFLDEYCEDKKSYKHNNDYLCIRRWVIDAVKDQQAKGKKPVKQNSFNTMIHTDYDFESIERSLLQ